ncbi:CinA family protein [Oceanidesulfovibrio marinus]|uniref:CinA family protein n=1 Tax=Oceanidesulfovibrio marinus TaxID=370038 RepID=A0ABX6NGF2_9BACT|nr:CinA family protein [Oceanidesulfovibrio marinus]QJT08665.1 CinA family protein [Oceanidesulfovibrio marinus]
MIDDIEKLSRELGEALLAQSLTLAVAESCTGGLVGGALTAISGSSDWFMGGVIAYHNEVKEQLLGVDAAILNTKGAVSEETVLAMAYGAAQLLKTQAALSISGVAGPTGGTPDKPVGMVCFGWHLNGETTACTEHLEGDREAVRLASVRRALRGMLRMVRGQTP